MLPPNVIDMKAIKLSINNYNVSVRLATMLVYTLLCNHFLVSFSLIAPLI